MKDVEDMTLMEKVEAIKQSVGPLDLADTLELDVEDGKIHSPWNEADNTPSCHLYEDHFYDFSTGQGGDVIDLYMLLAKCSWGSAVNRLLKGAASMDAEAGRISRPSVVEADLTEQWYEILHGTPSSTELWADRLKPVSPFFLNDLWAQEELCATNEAMWIPHWHGGKVTGIKIRRADGSKTAVPGSQFGRGLYWPDGWREDADFAVIAEGESDCWALTQHFGWNGLIKVFALPGGAGLWREQWLADLQQFERIYTIFDNDVAGKSATERVRRSIGWSRWAGIDVPGVYNDAREALANGWQPRLK